MSSRAALTPTTHDIGARRRWPEGTGRPRRGHDVERRFADGFAGRPAAALSLRRMVAQSVHMMGNAAALSVDENQRLLDEALALGWDHLYEKVSHVAAFARLCMAQGRPERAAAYLDPLLDEVERVDHLGRDEHLALLGQLRERLHGA